MINLRDNKPFYVGNAMDNKKLKGKLSFVVCSNCKAQRQYHKILIALLLVNKQVWILCSPTIDKRQDCGITTWK